MPVVEIPGLGVVEFPDSMSGDEISAAASKLYAENQAEPAAMTKQAAPAAEPYDPSFLGTMGRELSGGGSDIVAGIKQMFSLPDKGTNDPGLGALQAAGGAGRAIMSPITATGAVGGEAIGEAVRSATESTLGPTGSAIAGTAVGAPINAALQLVAAPKVIAASAPLVMKAIQGVARSLPGAQVTLREIGRKVVEALPAVMKPARPSADIYAEVNQLNPKVTLSEFSNVAARIAAKETALNKYGVANTGLASTTGKLAESTAASATLNIPKELPFQEVQAIRQRIGERIGELRAKQGEGLGAYKQLFKALSNELETTAIAGAQSANTPAARAAFAKLKEANAAANREFALGELDDIFNSTLGRALEGKDYSSSAFAQALNKIRDLRRSDELFAKGMGAQNLDKIESRLDDLRKLKITPPPKGANFGSALVATRMGAGTGLGAAVGSMIGGPQMATILGGMGGFAGAVGPPVISRILQSEKGTKALTKILQADGDISPQKLGAIFAMIQGEQALVNNIGEKVKSVLKSPTISIDDKIKAAMEKDVIFRQASEAEVLLNQ